MHCMVARAAVEFANEPALIATNRTLTYGSYHLAVIETLRRLREVGLQTGDRIAIQSKPETAFVVLLMAIFRLGATAMPLNDHLPRESAETAAREVGCKVIVGDLPKSNTFDTKLARFAIGDLVRIPDANGLSSAEAEIDVGDANTIVLTSGSTGSPKAVMLSYENHYFNALGANKNIPLSPGNRWLLSLPLYHVGGLAILFRAAIAGAAVVIPDSPTELTEALERFKPTHLSLVHTQLYRMIRDTTTDKLLSPLEAILLGGSAISLQLLNRAYSASLPVYPTYGLTEMASQVATADKRQLLNSGKILNHRQVSISDASEIMVKGPTLFCGYAKNGGINLPVDSEGWFATGDIGKVDSQGYLTVSGRKDNMFVCGGENICPEEIEAALLAEDGIENAVVVPVSDKEYGRRPVAFILSIDTNQFSPPALEHLPGFKRPIRYHAWPKDNREKYYKIDRRYLAELAEKLA